MKLLIIEDERVLRESMMTFFAATHEVDGAASLKEAARKLQQSNWDALILDLTLPDGDGLSWLRQWRQLISGKVLVLTANDQESTEIAGLQLADDFVVKPASLRVLKARLAKLMPQSILTMGQLEIALAKGQVLRAGRPITLTATEWRLLVYFAQNQGQLISREQLIAVIWDAHDNFVNDNTLTVTIKRLREKLEPDPTQPQLIRTIRGMGYFVDV